MKKLIIFFLLCPAILYAQVLVKGTVSGYGPNQSIAYFPPVGDYANTNYFVNSNINEDSTFVLRLDIKRPIFLYFRIASEPIFLLVRPNDTIDIRLKNTHQPATFLAMTGSNSKANYWYNIYRYNPGQIFAPHDSLLHLVTTTNAETTFNAIKAFLDKQCRPLDSLYQLNQIDTKSLDLYKKEVVATHLSGLIGGLNYAFQISHDAKIKDNIRLVKSKLYSIYDPLDPDRLQLVFGMNMLFSSYVSDFVPASVKVPADDTVFGVYNQFLRLPPAFCEDILGDALMIQKKLSANEFNFDRGYAVFKKKFPNSAYLPLLEKYRQREAASKAKNYPGITLDTIASPATFQDLIQRNAGHNIYIDMWATWCIPCRQEFPYYNKDIYEEFNKYDIKPVFISIDKQILKNNWKNVIFTSDLKGTHYLANEHLLKDIKSIIYDDKSILIPRYILINKKGQILAIDAPRPSQKGDLINLFAQKLTANNK